MKLSDGEKLILIMLCEIHEKLKIEKGTDTDLVKEVIYRGHFWALDWEFSGIFHGHADTEEQVHDTVDVMDMWRFLEEAFAKLSPEEKQRVQKEGQVFGHVQFPGWDGNGEAVYIGIARFLIEKLDRFQEFKDRELNSHMPTVQVYERMFAVFEPIRKTLIQRSLTVDEILQILNAAVHPESRKHSTAN